MSRVQCEGRSVNSASKFLKISKTIHFYIRTGLGYGVRTTSQLTIVVGHIYSLRSSTAYKVFRWSNDNIKTSIATISSQLLTLVSMLASAPALCSSWTQSKLPPQHASCIGVKPRCTEIRQHDSEISKKCQKSQNSNFLTDHENDTTDAHTHTWIMCTHVLVCLCVCVCICTSACVSSFTGFVCYELCRKTVKS